MTDQQSDSYELPDNWTEMTEDEQNAWVEAVLTKIYGEE